MGEFNLTKRQEEHYSFRKPSVHNGFLEINYYVGRYGKNPRCRNCCNIIPKGVKHLSVCTMHNYGGRLIPTTFNFCLKCSKNIMKEQVKQAKEYAKRLVKVKNSITHKDKLWANKKMKEQQLLEDI